MHFDTEGADQYLFHANKNYKTDLTRWVKYYPKKKSDVIRKLDECFMDLKLHRRHFEV